MAEPFLPVPTLTPSGCAGRRSRLVAELHEHNLDAALVTDRRHVYYFTGYWHPGRALFACAALVRRDGHCTLIPPFDQATDLGVDRVLIYEANRQATIVEDPRESMLRTVAPELECVRALGCDCSSFAGHIPGVRQVDLGNTLRSLRRAKDEDELAVIRGVLAAGDAAYDRACAVLEPGMTEVELYAQMHAAAVVAAGGPLLEFGNDFQVGSMGGPPRTRRVESGDAAILDIGVVVRGYSGDACRTFVVGEPASDGLRDAHRRVMHALAYVESVAKPGASCRSMHDEVVRMLDGVNGWSFPHHLGHGIGVSAHEAPRLNRHWDDHLEIGDVFTVEPGLYSDELRGGVRVENVYRVTANGVECLTHYPTGLVTTPRR